MLEDGVPQKIDTFQEAVDPVGIALLLDASGSMRRAEEAVKATAREFVSAVRPEDSLALITFADDALFGHLLMTDRQVTYNAIDRYATAGGTALYDGLWSALQHLKTAKGRRAIVVLSDGRDENAAGTAVGSAHTLKDVLGLIREVGAVIYPVGLGSRVDKAVLEQLADASGGDAYYSDQTTQLTVTFRRIVESMRQRYVLSYTSTNSEHDGEWRKIEVRPRNPAHVVKSPPGYFAPVE